MHRKAVKNPKKTSAVVISNETNKSVYRMYAPIYDFLFNRIFAHGRRRVIEKMAPSQHDRVLEVGIGTGLSLAMYPAETAVVGIDISEDMLDIARKKLIEKAIKNTELLVMDAQDMQFPDRSMSKIALMYVASVMPDPEKMFCEVKRVCADKGEVFILNHFTSTRPFFRALENALSGLSAKLGFRPEFGKDLFLKDQDMEVISIEPVNVMGYWHIIHLRKR